MRSKNVNLEQPYSIIAFGYPDEDEKLFRTNKDVDRKRISHVCRKLDKNTDLNMGRAKNDRWKKILGIILNIALLLLIDGLLVYTFINEGNRIYKGTIIKILLIVTGNILFLVLLFWGEKICSAIKNTTFLKIADVILLLATPGIVFMLVQMVTWVSGYKNKAVSLLEVPLTTVRQPIDAIGQKATEVINQLVNSAIMIKMNRGLY